MMFQTFSAVRFADLYLGTIALYTKDFVVILGLAPLESKLCLLQLGLQSTHVRVAVFEARLLDG